VTKKKVINKCLTIIDDNRNGILSVYKKNIPDKCHCKNDILILYLSVN